MDEELKPCPFCGGSEILVKSRKTTLIECASCGGMIFNFQNGKMRDAHAAWNRRAGGVVQGGAGWLPSVVMGNAACGMHGPDGGLSKGCEGVGSMKNPSNQLPGNPGLLLVAPALQEGKDS